MVVQSGHRRAGDPDVEDDDLAGVHGHGGQVVGVLFVPGQPQQGRVMGVLVDDGGVFQMPEVKHPHTSICSNTGKHVSTSTSFAECYVIHLLVMGYQLGLDMTCHHVHSAKNLTWN